MLKYSYFLYNINSNHVLVVRGSASVHCSTCCRHRKDVAVPSWQLAVELVRWYLVGSRVGSGRRYRWQEGTVGNW